MSSAPRVGTCIRYLETDPARRPLVSAAWLGDAKRMSLDE